MNPIDWQYTHQRQRKSVDPRQRTDSGEKTENVPHCAYSVNDKGSHIMRGANEELEHHNPSSHRHRSYRQHSNFTPEQATDSDSEPEELSKIDEELARKRRELQQIEKKILRKKTTNAVKATGPSLKAKTPCQMFKEEREGDLSHSRVDGSVKNTQPSMNTGGQDVGFSCSKWPSTYNNRPLKDRVNVILQRRWPDGFLAKAFPTPSDHLPSPNPVEKTNTLSLNKDNHPLKLRVRALMNRHSHSGVLDSHVEVPDPVVEPPSPGQSPSATVVENNLVVNGFQRFLRLLNTGVDIEMLTKIVNDDNELHPTGQELLHSQTPVVKEKSDVCKSESQQLQRGAGQRDRLSCSKERKTELLDQDISHAGGKRNIQPEEKSAQSDDRGGSHFLSSRRSRSPPVVEKKPKLEQNRGQLQNILKTIGLSLDADDLCKLAERTQERLYGMKHETKQSLDSTGVSKRSQQHVQSDHSRSSSSTLVSDSPSPTSHQYSCSETLRNSREQTQTSEYRHSRQKSREQEREQDGYRDKYSICSRDGSPDPHPSPEDPEYHVSYPDAASAIPTYNTDAASAVAMHNSDAASAVAMHNSDAASAVAMYNSDAASAVAMHNSDAASAIPTYISGVESATPTYISGVASEIPTYNSDAASAVAMHNSDAASAIPTYISGVASATPTYISGVASEIPTYNSDAASAIPTYTSVQYSEFTAYHSNGATVTSWNYGSNVIPPSSSSYPPGFYNYSMNPLCPSAHSGASYGQVHPHPQPPASGASYGQVHPYPHPPASGALYGQVHPHPHPPASGASYGQVHPHPQPPASGALYGQVHRHPQPSASGALYGQVHPHPQPPASGALYGQVHPRPHPPAGCNTTLGHSHFKADLSLSQGQTGQRSGRHLHVISTEKKTRGSAHIISTEKKTTGSAHVISTEKKTSGSAHVISTEKKTTGSAHVISTEKKTTGSAHVISTEKKTTGSAHVISTEKKTRGSAHVISTEKKTTGSAHVISTEKKTSGSAHVISTEKKTSGSAHVISTEKKTTGSAHVISTEKKTTGSAHVISTEKKTRGSAHVSSTEKKTRGSAHWLKKKETRKRVQEEKRVIRQGRGERRKLKATAKWIRKYISLVESNRDNYSEAEQQRTLKRLLQRQQRIQFLRGEKFRDLTLALSGIPTNTPCPEPPVNTPCPEPPVHTPCPEPPVNTPCPEPPVHIPCPEPPVHTPCPEPPVNTPCPEPPVQSSTEAQQLEGELSTDDVIKANLKKKLAAFNQKMKQQVPKPAQTQPNVNDW